ncbi:MAG: RMD1 family protein [Clostridium sp.]
MNKYSLKASFVAKEISLPLISYDFNINKKFKWEEPLVLEPQMLTDILDNVENKRAYIFHFGSIVTFNMTEDEMAKLIKYLNRLDKSIITNSVYSEDFEVIIDPSTNMSLAYNSLVTNNLLDFHLSILATVLGKSIALEKIENDIDVLTDDIEQLIELLDRGSLSLKDEKLSKISAKVLRNKYHTISYITLFEKPDIAWENEDAEKLFLKASDLFELEDRYDVIRHKSEVLLDVIETFSDLSHSKRTTRLEWIIVTFIIFEILTTIINAFS